MKLTILGSSDAFNSAGRCHSCYLIEGPDCGPVMIDIGGSGLVALRRAGREPDELAGLAITHLHGDHLGGLPFLFLDMAYNVRRDRPFPVVGPIGLKERVSALFGSTYRELSDMRFGFEHPLSELPPDEVTTLAGFEIRGFLADHMDPPDYPLSLRFTAPDGKSIAFSGDTAMNPRLLAAADGVDMLVAECSAIKPPVGRHCSWQDWKVVLPTLTTPRVVLSHLNFRVREQVSRLQAEAPANVRLTFADDGMVFEI